MRSVGSCKVCKDRFEGKSQETPLEIFFRAGISCSIKPRRCIPVSSLVYRSLLNPCSRSSFLNLTRTRDWHRKVKIIFDDIGKLHARCPLYYGELKCHFSLSSIPSKGVCLLRNKSAPALHHTGKFHLRRVRRVSFDKIISLYFF